MARSSTLRFCALLLLLSLNVSTVHVCLTLSQYPITSYFYWLIFDRVCISYQAIELSPSSPAGYYHLSRSLLGMGNLDEATAVVAKVRYRRIWQCIHNVYCRTNYHSSHRCADLYCLLFVCISCSMILYESSNINFFSVISILHFYV